MATKPVRPAPMKNSAFQPHLLSGTTVKLKIAAERNVSAAIVTCDRMQLTKDVSESITLLQDATEETTSLDGHVLQAHGC